MEIILPLLLSLQLIIDLLVDKVLPNQLYKLNLPKLQIVALDDRKVPDKPEQNPFLAALERRFTNLEHDTRSNRDRIDDMPKVYISRAEWTEHMERKDYAGRVSKLEGQVNELYTMSWITKAFIFSAGLGTGAFLALFLNIYRKKIVT